MAEYYVRPDGNNNNTGTGYLPNQAWATITKAAQTLVSGDVVYIAPGTYRETVSPVNTGSTGNIIYYGDVSCEKFLDKSKGDIIVSGIDTEDATSFARQYGFSITGGKQFLLFENITVENAIYAFYGSTQKTIFLYDCKAIKNIEYGYSGGGILYRCAFQPVSGGYAFNGYNGSTYTSVDMYNCSMLGQIMNLGSSSGDNRCTIAYSTLAFFDSGSTYYNTQSSSIFNFSGNIIYLMPPSSGIVNLGTGNNMGVIFNIYGNIIKDYTGLAGYLSFTSGTNVVTYNVYGNKFIQCGATIPAGGTTVTLNFKNNEVYRSYQGFNSNYNITINDIYFNECLYSIAVANGYTVTTNYCRFNKPFTVTSGAGTHTRFSPLYGGTDDDPKSMGYVITTIDPISGIKSLKLKGYNHTPAYFMWVPCKAGIPKTVKFKLKRNSARSASPKVVFGNLEQYIDKGIGKVGVGWESIVSVNHSGGSCIRSNGYSDYIQYDFTGTGVKVIGVKTTNQGICAISIDNGPETIVDCYSAGTQYQNELASITGLTYGPHTVYVRVTGQKNGYATDYYLTVDALDIQNQNGTYTRVEEDYLPEALSEVSITYTHHKTELVPLWICCPVSTSGTDYCMIDDITL